MLKSDTSFRCRICFFTHCLLNVVVISLCVCLIPSVSQAFNPSIGANKAIHALAVQPDGKVLIGGDFTEVNGVSRNRIARLNADGSVDQTFDPDSGVNRSVVAIAVQADGKVLIGGFFTQVGGTSRDRIARLNADGSVDQTFDAAAGANDVIETLAVQADGKVLIGGRFRQVNDTISRNRIARLNADGTVDQTFASGSGANNIVWTIVVQADGKVLIGGHFTEVNGISRNGVARLNADGSFDQTFDPGSGATNPGSNNFKAVFSIVVQADGKVLIAGQFIEVNGFSRKRIARLNADGSVDQTFNPSDSEINSSVSQLAVQPDGRVLIGGTFTELNGISRNGIARLNADGSFDQTFDPGSGANNFVTMLVVQADGKVLITGGFTEVNGFLRNRIARLNADGSIEDSSELCIPIRSANGNVAVICL